MSVEHVPLNIVDPTFKRIVDERGFLKAILEEMGQGRLPQAAAIVEEMIEQLGEVITPAVAEAQLKAAHVSMKAAEREFERVRKEVFEPLWPEGTHRYWQESEQTEFDEQKSRAVLPSEAFVQVVSKKQVDALHTLGLVTDDDLKQCTTKKKKFALVVR